jgi:predicted Holliday junction resolvase-like endonuclease
VPRREILEILSFLERDRSIWATAECGHEYRLADSELFYRDELTPRAIDFRKQREEELIEFEQEVKNLQHKLTEGFTKKSVEVKLGKTVEKICHVLPGFPYSPFDCRALFDPIDYVVFIGASRNQVTQVDFVEVKTGQSSLNKAQRQIRDAVNDRHVRVREVSQ